MLAHTLPPPGHRRVGPGPQILAVALNARLEWSWGRATSRPGCLAGLQFPPNGHQRAAGPQRRGILGCSGDGFLKK